MPLLYKQKSKVEVDSRIPERGEQWTLAYKRAQLLAAVVWICEDSTQEPVVSTVCFGACVTAWLQ